MSRSRPPMWLNSKSVRTRGAESIARKSRRTSARPPAQFARTPQTPGRPAGFSRTRARGLKETRQWRQVLAGWKRSAGLFPLARPDHAGGAQPSSAPATRLDFTRALMAAAQRAENRAIDAFRKTNPTLTVAKKAEGFTDLQEPKGHSRRRLHRHAAGFGRERTEPEIRFDRQHHHGLHRRAAALPARLPPRLAGVGCNVDNAGGHRLDAGHRRNGEGFDQRAGRRVHLHSAGYRHRLRDPSPQRLPQLPSHTRPVQKPGPAPHPDALRPRHSHRLIDHGGGLLRSHLHQLRRPGRIRHAGGRKRPAGMRDDADRFPGAPHPP